MNSNNSHLTPLELSMYLDSVLEPDKAESVTNHLSVCTEFSRALEEMRRANEDILRAVSDRRNRLLKVDESGGDPLKTTSRMCKNDRLLSRYLDGRLSPRKREKYERHIEKCNYRKLRLGFFLGTERVEERELSPEEESFIQTTVDGLLKDRTVADARSWRLSFTQLASSVAGYAALPIIFVLSLSSIVFIPLLYWLMSYFRYFNRTVMIMYAVFTPFIGVVFKGKSIFQTLSEFLTGKERDRKRMNSIIIVFYITMVIALNCPLLESIYTGMDMYGFFRFKLYEEETPDMALIRGIMFSMLVNIVIATFSTVVMYGIHRLYLRRYAFEGGIPYISSTFAMVIIPIVLAYIPVAIFARRTVDVFIVELFLPIVAAFLACIGFSHPKNKLDLFWSKVLVLICVAGIFLGVLAAAGLATLHLTNVIPLEIPDTWRSHVAEVSIDWASNMLGYAKADYMSRWRNGFAWMVSIIAIYVVAVLGFFTTMTVLRYQYNYASGKIDNRGR